jgi:hypothetical protein
LLSRAFGAMLAVSYIAPGHVARSTGCHQVPAALGSRQQTKLHLDIFISAAWTAPSARRMREEAQSAFCARLDGSPEDLQRRRLP